jgi:hypothetical protein
MPYDFNPFDIGRQVATTKAAGITQMATDAQVVAGARADRALSAANVATSTEALDPANTSKLLTVAGVNANQAARARLSYFNFTTNPASSLKGGGASVGTAASTNIISFPQGHMECFNIGTQTIIDPSLATLGLNIAKDQTNAEGASYAVSGIAAGSKHAYTIGTDGPFRIEGRFNCVDGSGAAALFLGFRRAAAEAADYNDYTDLAAIGLIGSSNPAKIQIVTILNNAATTTTDTTDTLADGVSRYFRVDVSAAGVVTFAHGASVATLAAPTVTAAFTFDSTDVVVPVIHFLNGADVAGDTFLQFLYVGLTADYTAK